MCIRDSRSTTLWEPARLRLEEVVAHRLQDIDKRLERVTLEMLPLSPAEPAQLALMLQVPGEEEIVSTAHQIARRLQDVYKRQGVSWSAFWMVSL